MTPPLSKVKTAVSSQISAFRREAGARSLLAFAKTYLPAHQKLPPSRMHEELFDLLSHATEKRGARLAIAAPRGHAKSTIVSLVYILWCICYEREPFILLISNTLDQAGDFLSQIKNELQSNPCLLEDFPEVCEPPGAVPPAPRWRRDEIITRNGIKVTALGTDKKIRGRRHRESRPTLIIMDDIENETEVRSAEQRVRKEEWFQRAVLKAGTAITNVIVVGTVLHYDALLCNLIDPRKNPGWTGRKYQAVRSWSAASDLWARWEGIFYRLDEFDGGTGPQAARAFFRTNENEMLEGTDVLWPECEDYYALMELRLTEGRASFDSEKQNEPVNPEDCYFQESDFQYWDDEFPTLEALVDSFGGHHSFYGACDPSMGRAGKSGDDSAIITLLRAHRTGVLYVIGADIRRRKPDRILEDIIELHKIWSYRGFGMESNQFQEFLSDELQRRSRAAFQYISIRNIKNTSDKEGRIQSLQPLITSGTIRFRHQNIQLLEQLRQFPMGAHDDGPDALEMAVSMASTRPDGVTKPRRIVTPRRTIYDIPTDKYGGLDRFYGLRRP